ncbi:TonB-dependent receptor [Dysgonomonas sp. ZJ709]|uniref:SusC/RagA family TonB-linked outer membrane protein n=1 Tax=Dysgonomonas sp. ZJ709 TaxID=2709797 RepID=UPI0013EB50DF|nr:TonB-dependent receptor [Dysgonomonas sp. ZJ709]
MELKSFISPKSKKKILLLLLVGVFALFDLSAQNSGTLKITGQVIDTSTNETVIGATVKIKNTTTGTITDDEGRFELNAPANATLVVSFIGYKSTEVTVDNKTHLSILLDEDVELLNEVVVIGYGQVKKGDTTGSLTTITPDQLNKGNQLTAEDALIGKMAGVNVIPGTGAPGDEGTIRIRMGASLSADNDPLIVIDGIPVHNTSISAINPNDIATFTVLKDASATAIYGSRASNGVIIITTKKGNANGGKPKVNYSANFSVSEVMEYLDVLSTDEFRDTFNKFSGAPDSFKLGDASTDWQKEIYRNALGTDHNLSVTGATLNVPYRVSVGYANQNGIIRENNYERYNLGLGISPQFFEKHLAFDINLKSSLENNKSISTGVIGAAAGFDPTRPVYQKNPNDIGLGYFTWMTSGTSTPISLAPSNPVADLKLSDRQNKIKRHIGNIAANYKIHGFEDLVLNVNAGFDIKSNDYTEIVPQNAPSMWTSNLQDGTGLDYFTTAENRNYLLDFYANYNKDFGAKHHFDAMAGYGWQRFWYKNTGRTHDTEGNEIKLPTGDEAELFLLSFFGRLNYSYAQKLLLTATLRSDASSRFAKEKRWGYFPSVALAYRMSEEGFMKDIKALSDLKLRLSYGQTGQQDIGTYYQHLGTYSTSYDNSRYQFGNEWITLYRPNGYDPLIKWETTSTYNVGVDYGFLNNRIYGSIDAYKRYTKDLLNNIFVPAGSNFTNIIDTNIGDMESQGVEFAISAIPFKTKDWEWSVSGNFTWNTSEITKLNTIDTDNNYMKTGSAGGTGKYLQINKVGETPNTFFLLQQAYGDDGKPLDGKYVAKDGSITSSEEDANKYVTGKSSRVPYFYGLSTKLLYKQWDFGMNGHGSFGNYVYNYQAASESFASLYSANGVSSNIMRSTLESGFTQERLYTDYFLEKGNFFKLDNITLGYSFNKLWNTSSTMRMAFSVQNVCIITNYSGIDPEVYSGIDRNVYQRPRMYTLSLNLNF